MMADKAEIQEAIQKIEQCREFAVAHNLQGLVEDCDRRIADAKKALEEDDKVPVLQEREPRLEGKGW